MDDFCRQPPVVRVVTEQFARHYCKACFAQWKSRLRDMAKVLGDRGAGPTPEGAREWFEERLRRRVAEELAAVEEDERREKVRSGL